MQISERGSFAPRVLNKRCSQAAIFRQSADLRSVRTVNVRATGQS